MSGPDIVELGSWVTLHGVLGLSLDVHPSSRVEIT